MTETIKMVPVGTLPRYECKICHNAFTTSQALAGHIRFSHPAAVTVDAAKILELLATMLDMFKVIRQTTDSDIRLVERLAKEQDQAAQRDAELLLVIKRLDRKVEAIADAASASELVE